MFKATLKKILPRSIKYAISDFRIKRSIARIPRENAGKTAEEVFTAIYEKNLWGGKSGTLCSGRGSSGAAAAAYVKTVNEFIKENDVKSVLDLGCGDFAIGKQIICDSYTGVDVVRAVVDQNNSKFGTETRRFIQMDITTADDLPSADLCLVRQVLQHLTNEQIKSVLNRLGKFRWVVITEHQPADRDFISENRDKVHGQDTRLYHGSGVYLDKPPFNVEAALLFEHPGIEDALDVHERGPIRSFLVKV